MEHNETRVIQQDSPIADSSCFQLPRSGAMNGRTERDERGGLARA